MILALHTNSDLAVDAGVAGGAPRGAAAARQRDRARVQPWLGGRA